MSHHTATPLWRTIIPNIAEHLDCPRLEALPRIYLLDDWREREMRFKPLPDELAWRNCVRSGHF